MVNRIKKYATYLILIALAGMAGFNIGKNKEKSDINIVRPEFELSLKLSKKGVIDNYGEKDLEKLLEARMLEIYDEVSTPNLKELYNRLHMKYLEMKIRFLEDYRKEEEQKQKLLKKMLENIPYPTPKSDENYSATEDSHLDKI